jgi:hypothetical protein
MRSHIVWLGYHVKCYVIIEILFFQYSYLMYSGYPSCLCWVCTVGSRGYSSEHSGEDVWFTCLGFDMCGSAMEAATQVSSRCIFSVGALCGEEKY